MITKSKKSGKSEPIDVIDNLLNSYIRSYSKLQKEFERPASNLYVLNNRLVKAISVQKCLLEELRRERE